MKELWIEIDPTIPEKDKLLKVAAESSDVIVEGSKATVVSTKGEILVLDNFDEETIARLKREGKKVALRINIRGKEDEDTAVKAAELSTDYLILKCLDWRVIPLENLIAKTRGRSKLIAEVANADEARLVLETLELGTDGVLLKTSSSDELTRTAAAVKKQTSKNRIINSQNRYRQADRHWRSSLRGHM